MPELDLRAVVTIDVGQRIGQCRAAPVSLGGKRSGVVIAYAADFDVDPYEEMFFFPTDTLKLAVYATDGALVWRRDLGPGAVPGHWFTPVLPFDLDGDGVDEIWTIASADPAHPMSLAKRELLRLDGLTGEITGRWPWKRPPVQSMSHRYRDFLIGGYVRGTPVLITASGTYESMHLYGWNADQSTRWEHHIAADAPGARGSHMCPIIDLDGDGVDELLWGERCIELDKGVEKFCADRDVYSGHSDVIQPTFDLKTKTWSIYTVRESDPKATPRVVSYDDRGGRRWGALDHGHIDAGWTARLKDDGGHLAWAMRIGAKMCGPDGRHHTGIEEFLYDADTGEPVPLPVSFYRTDPVDLDGDGLHELIRGVPSGNGEILDRTGKTIGSIGTPAALACKFLDLPGEQLVGYHEDGRIIFWANAAAVDSPAALARYANPVYTTNRRILYNKLVLGGI